MLVSLLSTLVVRGGMLSPLLLLTLPACQRPPPLSLSLPLLKGAVWVSEKMGDRSAYRGGRQKQTTSNLTATPSATGRLLSPLTLVSSCLLDLYHQCVDSGGLVRVLYDVRGGMEKRCSSTNSHLLQLRLLLLNLHQPSLDV
jgi:hypothetical protein